MSYNYPSWFDYTSSSYSSVRVKVNPTWDVIEYLEWPVKWEQLFANYNAVIREVMQAKNCSKEDVENKYLLTINEFDIIKSHEWPYHWNYHQFLRETNMKFHLAGGANEYKSLNGIWKFCDIWLSGWYRAYFSGLKNSNWYDCKYHNDGWFGYYSVLLLKN